MHRDERGHGGTQRFTIPCSLEAVHFSLFINLRAFARREAVASHLKSASTRERKEEDSFLDMEGHI